MELGFRLWYSLLMTALYSLIQFHHLKARGENEQLSGSWWLTPVISILKRQREEDLLSVSGQPG